MSRRHSAYIPFSVTLPLFIYRFNQVFNFHIYHLPVFHSFTSMSLLPSRTTSGILRNYYFFRATSRLIQDRDQSIKIQFSAPYAPIRLIVRFSKIWHLHAGLSTSQTRHAKKSLYHLKMPSTWHWYRRNYYPASSSLRASKSCFCCRQTSLRL